jgi:hypothetical protein
MSAFRRDIIVGGTWFALLTTSTGAAHGQALVALPPWRVTLAAQAGAESNPRVSVGAADASATGRLRLGVERAFNRRRAQLALAAEGSALRYAGAPDLGRGTWALGTRATWLPGRRTQVRVDASARADLSRDLRALTDGAFVLDQVRTRSTRASTDVRYRLARHLTTGAGASYERFSFGAAGPVGGATLAARGSLEWLAARNSALSLSLETQRQEDQRTSAGSNPRDGASQAALVTWTLGSSAGVQGTFGVGLSRLRPIGGAPARQALLLATGVRARARRHTLAFAGERRVAQAFGLGRSGLTSSLSLTDAVALGPRCDVSLRGSWSRTSDPGDAAFTLTSWGAGAELAWRARPHTRAQLTYTLFRGERSLQPARVNHVFLVSVSTERALR